jgi:hypothetical protein
LYAYAYSKMRFKVGSFKKINGKKEEEGNVGKTEARE